jgi:hypothetical protein
LVLLITTLRTVVPLITILGMVLIPITTVIIQLLVS